MDFVHDPILNFSNFLLISFICSSSCKMASWLLPLEDRFRIVAFLSTRDTECRTCFLELERPRSSVALPLTSLFPVSTATDFPELEGTSPERGCCCCCCCDCQLLLSVTFGAGRGVESLSNSVDSLLFQRFLCRCNLPAQDCVRLLHVISSARIAILDLVLWKILPRKRHPDHVSNCCDCALSWEL